MEDDLKHQPRQAEAHGTVPSDIHLTLWDLFQYTAAAYPERDAIVSLWQPSSHLSQAFLKYDAESNTGTAGHPLTWSYHDLMGLSGALALSLKKLGCDASMRLAAVLWNSADWGLFFWTAVRLGVAFVPIDPRDDGDAELTLSSLEGNYVVVVQDEKGADCVDASTRERATIRIQCSGNTREGWTALRKILRPSGIVDENDKAATSGAGEPDGLVSLLQASVAAAAAATGDAALLIYTSGTTGSPKGCLHTHRRLVSQTCDFDPNTDASLIDRWLIHTPVSHIFAVNNCLRAWKCGDCVVFPSRKFEIGATIDALVSEKCTIMSATPTLAKALLSHPKFPDSNELNLELITLGGMHITEQDISLCKNGLGAKAVTQAYGMTEGAPLISLARTDPILQRSTRKGVGKVLPGAKIRICHPDSGAVLKRGEIGELHVSGESVITCYLGDRGQEMFYDDSISRWLKTGDQAKMDEDGIVHILGRFKDIIIRGGENISPARLEAQIKETIGHTCHVIGMPDEVAGQVPIAVIELPDSQFASGSFGRIKESGLTGKFNLGGMFTLQELGLERVPVTALGKVKKGALQSALLTKHLWPGTYSAPESPHMEWVPSSSSHTLENLKAAWRNVTGLEIQTGDDMLLQADSITLLRYCDSVQRNSGQRLYLQDLGEYNTLEKQGRLLGNRRAIFLTSEDSKETVKDGSTLSFGFTNGNAKLVSKSAAYGSVNIGEPLLSQTRERLDSMGHQDLEIEDISPVRESLRRMVNGQRDTSYQVRIVFKVSARPQDVRRGLERTLVDKPLFRAFKYTSEVDTLHHVVIKPATALYDAIISEHVVRRTNLEEESLPSEEKRQATSIPTNTDFEPSPWMFRASIVEDTFTKETSLVMTYNHSTVDALELLSWHFDLDMAINGAPKGADSKIPNRFFTDLLIHFQHTELARASVKHVVSRLRGISRVQGALWPRKRAPGWMISHDGSSPHAAERALIREKTWEGRWSEVCETFLFPRCARIVRLPGLKALHEEHGISPEVLTRSALILLNVLQTGIPWAMFSSFESGRSWPFVPQWMEKLLPPAMSIDGPTAQWVLSAFTVDEEETVSEFLRRQSREYAELQRHVHAPWDQVVSALAEEGPVAVEASFRQAFVWDVSLGLSVASGRGSNLKSLEPVRRLDWADCGLFWNAYATDAEHIFFVASWDTAQMNDDEVNAQCDTLAELMRRICREAEWETKVARLLKENKGV